jgi:hypothetical protein
VKLALALVAALSLAACVDEPTGPAESLSGIGPSKSFTTDPTLLVPKDFEQNVSFNGHDVTDMAAMFDLSEQIIDFTECRGLECATTGLRMNDTDVLFYNAEGKYLGLGHAPRK